MSPIDGYMIGRVLGGLLIPVVIYLIAILVAKPSKVAGWIIFAVGAGLSALSLLGESRSLTNMSTMYSSDLTSSLETAFMIKLFGIVVLTAAAAFAISRRARK